MTLPKKGEPSRNPSGISKEKMQLRRLFEKFVTNENRMELYLSELHKLATADNNGKVKFLAIKEFLDKCLGKDFTLNVQGGDIFESLAQFMRDNKNGGD